MKANFPKVVAIIQARMSSSRLPGKVLLDITGQPMLARVYQRAKRATLVDQVIVATTTSASDDPIVDFCTVRQVPFFRGSLYDVLDRFYQTAKEFKADVVVRITADCPVIDPELIDATVNALWERSDWKVALDRGEKITPSFDFAATRLPPPWKRTYPIGLDVEACTFAGLERAWKEATAQHQREHVMPYFYDQEGRFRYTVLAYPIDYGELRWTVDTPQDLELIRQVYARFPGRDDFNWLEILDLFLKDKNLARVNEGTHHKNLYEVDQDNNTQRG